MAYRKPWLTLSPSQPWPTPPAARCLNGSRSGSAVGDLAEGLPVSRPAVSQHLVLKAGLVTDRPDGARRVYQIDPQGLEQIRAWLDRFWDTALDAFAAEVERTANETSDDKKRQP